MKHGVGASILVASMLFCSSLINYNVNALTYSSSADLEYTLLPSLTVSFTPNTGFVIDNLNAGNSAYSNTVTVSVSSNASDGYILAATVGSTSDNNRNNNKLVHSNNTNYFDSVASNANLSLSNLGNDKWGYATYDSTNELWSNYNGLATVGSTGTTLLSTNNAATKTLDMRIGASATSTQISGTYTNVINFTATANIVTYSYSISFATNNTGTVTNMPTNVTSASFNTGDTIQISSTNPTADNGTFLGWCDGTVSGTTCTGTLYQPGDYIKLTNPSSSTTNNISLTAVWQLNVIVVANGQDMQAISSKSEGGCPSNLVEGQAYTLTDTRDNKTYRVARLKDGNCWMLDNLALDIVSVSINNLKGKTNASDTTIDYLKGVQSRDVTQDPNGYYPTSGVDKTWGNSNKSYFSIPMIATDSTTGGTCNNTDACVNDPTAGEWSSTSTTLVTMNGITSIAQGKIGVYYNYCAASAGSYCCGNGADRTGCPSTDPDVNTIQDVKEDICPKGWRLPTSSADGEFQALFDQYNNDSAAFQAALSTAYTGFYFFDINVAQYQGSATYPWSSTWGKANCANNLLVSSTTINPTSCGINKNGLPVRCILD